MHVIRKGYGWTDNEIIAQIEQFGDRWAIDAYRRILSDDALELHWAVNVAQAARTPMDKKSGKGSRTYVRILHRSIDKMTPWKGDSRLERLKALKDKGPDKEALAATEKLVKTMGL